MIKKIISLIVVTCIPVSVAFADEFIPLSQNIPGGTDKAFGGGLFKLLNYLFTISIGVAAILAVIMLTIGGFKYMTTESIFAIGDAKDNIKNAIIGILIVLTAVLILSVINPDIVQFNLFRRT